MADVIDVVLVISRVYARDISSTSFELSGAGWAEEDLRSWDETRDEYEFRERRHLEICSH